MMASVGPVPPPETEGTADVVEVESSAAGLLERAFVHFQRDQYGAASEAFRAAIQTGNLNDAGRALAYWHVFLAESMLNNEDEGAEALSSFVVVGQDVVDARTTLRYAVTSAGDFVQRFDLSNRLSRARALLSAAWAHRVPQFGRSVNEPVPVLDETELTHFLASVEPCASDATREVVRESVFSPKGAELEHALVRCSGEHAEYYLQFVQPTR